MAKQEPQPAKPNPVKPNPVKPSPAIPNDNPITNPIECRESLATRYQTVLQRITQAQGTSQRTANDATTLLAVSKTRSAEEIAALYQLGARQFGENYLQEAEEKITQLKHLVDMEWHFIGHLQSNKSRVVAEQFSWLHTLHSLKLAKRLSQQRPDSLPPLNVCIQINIDAEESKSGILPTELTPLARSLSELPGLKLRGLMAIPAPTTIDATATPSSFERMQTLLHDLQHTFKDEGIDTKGLDTLSMGMSGDLEAAIQAGATIVRVGTALFGPRAR